jgi:hypothetical protein
MLKFWILSFHTLSIRAWFTNEPRPSTTGGGVKYLTRSLIARVLVPRHPQAFYDSASSLPYQQLFVHFLVGIFFMLLCTESNVSHLLSFLSKSRWKEMNRWSLCLAGIFNFLQFPELSPATRRKCHKLCSRTFEFKIKYFIVDISFFCNCRILWDFPEREISLCGEHWKITRHSTNRPNQGFKVISIGCWSAIKYVHLGSNIIPKGSPSLILGNRFW